MHSKEKYIFRVNISNVKEIKFSADELVQKLLALSKTETVCFLDSCGVNHLGSHLLIAGIKPTKVLEIANRTVEKTLSIFDKTLSNNPATIFTISYDFGLKLEKVTPRTKEFSTFDEPDIFLAAFDCLIIHDYNNGKTYLKGNEENFDATINLLESQTNPLQSRSDFNSTVTSNFTKAEYISTIKKIQEYIREGETYQTNLTQQFRAELPKDLTPQQVFWNLRKSHPAPFASFIKRKNDFVVSISPERFIGVESDSFNSDSLLIKTSPIKGTRPRGKTVTEDLRLQNELIESKKDHAENTMIVDLLRNDLGRICEFGSVKVEKLCELEKHPSLFHLVSTVSGKLRKDVNFGSIIKATFPCGSITGCPKIRTMQIIDELETVNRGLSMGTIGYSLSNKETNNINSTTFNSQLSTFHTSVAIRTMVIRDRQAIFNVGGGIVIDSDPLDEYKESLIKAKALFNAIGIKNI